MLRQWQMEFPHIFEKFPNIFNELSDEAQEVLSQLFFLGREQAKPEIPIEEIITGVLNFIGRALKAGVNFPIILNFLSQNVALEGLSRALTLFDLSRRFSYRQEHFAWFGLLSKVLANPLCQTIFDARWRCFSDYMLPSEPLKPDDADAIIERLASLAEKNKVRTFFDFFVRFRPFPGSQDYIVEIDVADRVNTALYFYCKATIAAIKTQADFRAAQKMITALRKSGGDVSIFHKIKYEVASSIESADFCSTRDYSMLMDIIWSALNQPQVNLSDFTGDFQNRRALIGSALRGQSFLTGSVSSNTIDQDNEQKTNLSI